MSVIPISSEPIRKKWLSHYHQIEKKLSKLKREWNAFENEAQTQYQKWYHQTFAPLLSELTSIGEETRELQVTLSAIRAQREVNRLSKKAALEYVLDAIQNKRDPFPSPAETEAYENELKRTYTQEFKESHSPAGEEDIDPDLLERARQLVMDRVRIRHPYPPQDPLDALFLSQAIDDAIHATYERLKRGEHLDQNQDQYQDQYQNKPEFDFDEDEEHDHFAHSDQNLSERTESASNPTHRAEDYKLLYRKIVKLLHPDRGEEMSRDEKTLWSEAQRAYHEKNADALRTILLRVEGQGSIQIQNVDSIGEIMNITLSLHEEYNEINFLQRRTKKEWVYRFWASEKRKKNREKLMFEISGQLQRQLFSVRYQLRDLKQELGQLKKATEKKIRSGKR